MFKRVLCVSALVTSLATPAMAAQTCDEKKPETAPASRFKDSGNGTITDSKTSKVWLRCALGMSWNGSTCEGQTLTYNWNMAQMEIGELNKKRVGGRNDWRMPTSAELQGIVESRCFKPAINLEVFPFTPETGFWTSTDVPGANPRAEVVLFLHGKAYIGNKTQSWRVRPVADK